MSETTNTLTASEVRRYKLIITVATAVVAVITVLFSVITSTRLVAAHGVPQWAAVLPGVAVDTSFVMALNADAFLSRHGLPEPGAWPKRLRWFTGLASVALNDGQAATMKDWAAVAIHSVAPLLLLLLAEAAPAYRRAFAEALKTITPEPEAERIADVSETAPEALPQRVRVALPPRLLAQATTVNAAALEKTGKPASIRSLMAELRVGADRAKDVKRALSAVPATS